MSTRLSNTRLAERFETLQDIAVELIAEKNQHDILSLIVNKAMDLLICDAGSLYLRNTDETIIFEVAANRSMKIPFERFIMMVKGKGISVYSYRTGKALNIKDVYKIKGKPFNFNKGFDEKTGYRTRSMLVQPLVSSKGEKLGVLQLINRKNRNGEKWPSQDAKKIAKMPFFNKEDQRLVKSFAALASAAIENALLYKNIEALFEGFVKASVDAIETRDPPTRGHSERVALLTVDLAEKVSRSSDSDLKKIKFNDTQLAEVRYAALLHDFGKIGVRESTLLKSEKLFTGEKARIRARLDEFLYNREIELLRSFMKDVQEGRRTMDAIKQVEQEIQDFRLRVEGYWDAVIDLNRPTVLNEDRSKALRELEHLMFRGKDGQKRLLEEEEVKSLSIQKGSLSDEERFEIEQHVTHTFHFLKKIPWTREFSGIPEIAYAHHEKLDGTGYPRGVPAKEIPVQSRIMTICDIFDALAANDRPYKKALPFDRALDILEMETKDGKLDERLFRVFREAKVYENPEFLALTERSDDGDEAATA